MPAKSHKIKPGKDRILMNILAYVLVTVFAIMCLFPFLLMITSSFMEEEEILTSGFKLFPEHWSLSAYEFLFKNGTKLAQSYLVTIFITLVGTAIGLFLMAMAGYVLCRKECRYRNQISFFIYFTTLFSAGLIPTYIWMVNGLHMKDNIWALILPGLMSPWSIFLMKNFMKSVPDSLYESATIDGAGQFRIFWSIYMPLSKPSLATVGLFLALSYWNSWYNAMLYMETESKFPLQYFLQRMVSEADVNQLIQQGLTINTGDLPTEAIKMATAVLAVGPIILLYPFLQKYFVTGITVGAVKG